MERIFEEIMTPRKITPTQLAKYILTLKSNQVDGSLPKTSELSVEVFHENTSLFKFQDSTSVLEITSPPELRDDVIQAIDRCGLYNLEVEFILGMQDNMRSSNSENGSSITRKNRTDHGFKSWFGSVQSSLANKVYLIPDTNFLRRQYYSNYIKKISGRDKMPMFMRIPRLGILEVENKYNRNKPGNRPEVDVKQTKEKFDNKERERAKERRIAFQTMSEFLSIKQNGGDILQHFDMSLLQSFNSGAGKDNADAWIRKEISNNLDNLRKHSYVGKDTIE
ncbi:MAG: hypothetical protein WA667_17325 [Candidatus Nitrosopolaris sp.]